MHLVMIGGSDAGISAALRARELDPGADVTVVLEDAYPNFSICGIPYYVSGEVTHWRNLAHRTVADLEAAGMRLRLDTTARRIDVPGRKLLVTSADGGRGAARLRQADRRHRRGPGPAPDQRPGRPGALGPGDGVHLLHSMGDTFAVMRTLEQAAPASAVIVGAGYIGLEMADALTVRGLAGHPDGTAARGAAHRRPGARRPGPRRTGRPRRRGADRHHRPGDQQGPARRSRAAARPGHRGRRHGRDPRGRHGAGRRRGAARHHPGRRRRGRARRQGRDRGRPACGPACPTCSPPGTASSPTTGCSARPTCRWAPPRTSRAGSPARTPSAGTGSSPAASAPRSSRSSTRPPPAPGCATTKPPRPGSTRSPSAPQADDHKAYYPGSHRITMRVTGDRATGRLLGMQLFGHKHAEIAKRIDIAATAIFHGMTVDAVSDLDLSYTPPLGSPWEAVQMGAQAWVRDTQRR